MRSFDAAIAFALACSLAFGLGCVTVEPIHRPPTPAEIDRVNAAQGPRIVELIPGAGSSPRIDHVVSADATNILVAPEDGLPYPLRLEDVRHFSARRAGPGAAIGAGVGAGVAASIIVGVASLEAAFHGDPAAVPRNGGPSCNDYCGTFWRPQNLIGLSVLTIGVGALIGAVVGSRHLFVLDAGAAPPHVFLRPFFPLSASVVAVSAEVRSAPFTVARVVVVLAQGQRLFVDATPNAGWRVATLLDGRMGYILDAEVKVDSP